jgi:membrane-associated protease RseP (regulator of RpoE activity)
MLQPVVEELWPPPVVRRKDRLWLHVLLFLLTVASTTAAGVFHYLGFIDARSFSASPSLIAHGFLYSGTILSILGAHEMGHYIACRHYGIDATLPFFLPAPFLTGTFGAVIRIRQPILDKAALFDIGIAGPIAGFVVAVPALMLGISLSRVIPPVAAAQYGSLGEPLLLKLAAWLLWRHLPDGAGLLMHPIAFAAWFGLLMTALNLFPIAQLDGGHIAYSVFGDRIATGITYGSYLTAVGLALWIHTWAFWVLLLTAMLYFAGPRHPPVLDEKRPLNWTRLLLAAFAVVMLVLCFTPAPFGDLGF